MNNEFFMNVRFEDNEICKKLNEVEEALRVIRDNIGFLGGLMALRISPADTEQPTEES